MLNNNTLLDFIDDNEHLVFIRLSLLLMLSSIDDIPFMIICMYCGFIILHL
jgi:hypothetical protein